jgi:hypothetical protein
MMRRLRVALAALLFAALGAVAGRVAADLRRRAAAGEALAIDPRGLALRPQDIAPGIVAAMRVGDRPWSFLHIPPWMAAFFVSFTVAAFVREIGELTGAGGRDSAQSPTETQTETSPETPAGTPPETGEAAAEPAPPWTASQSPPTSPGGAAAPENGTSRHVSEARSGDGPALSVD